ncbi:MAG: phosphatase PAP2 family protein [Planctomycetes bacterium]|nr:phosphatase PAP2 family protein [Planctomycetota bacterium]MBI3846481.1 phosphatase PAP2 family protein [Planctomycetota bacterium]
MHPSLVLHVSFFVFLSATVAVGFQRVPHPLVTLGLNVGAIALSFAVAATTRHVRESRGAILRFVLTLALVPIAFTELGWIIPYLRPISAEPLLIRADQWLFGTNPTQWAEKLQTPWLTEILQWIYASFYFIPTVLAARLIATRRWLQLDVSVVAVILGFYSSYLGYFVLPARSPDKILPHGEPLVGVLAAESIRRTLENLENIVFDCFPSGHTEVSLLVLWLAWRFDRIAFSILVAPITLLVVSTIYLRYHYGIDLVAAVVFAIGVLLALRPIEKRMRAHDAVG